MYSYKDAIPKHWHPLHNLVVQIWSAFLRKLISCYLPYVANTFVEALGDHSHLGVEISRARVAVGLAKIYHIHPPSESFLSPSGPFNSC